MLWIEHIPNQLISLISSHIIPYHLLSALFIFHSILRPTFVVLLCLQSKIVGHSVCLPLSAQKGAHRRLVHLTVRALAREQQPRLAFWARNGGGQYGEGIWPEWAVAGLGCQIRV